MIHPIWKQLEHNDFDGGYCERVKYYYLFALKSITFTSPLIQDFFSATTRLTWLSTQKISPKGWFLFPWSPSIDNINMYGIRQSCSGTPLLIVDKGDGNLGHLAQTFSLSRCGVVHNFLWPFLHLLFSLIAFWEWIIWYNTNCLRAQLSKQHAHKQQQEELNFSFPRALVSENLLFRQMASYPFRH